MEACSLEESARWIAAETLWMFKREILSILLQADLAFLNRINELQAE
jgi:hypothetical protein